MKKAVILSGLHNHFREDIWYVCAPLLAMVISAKRPRVAGDSVLDFIYLFK